MLYKKINTFLKSTVLPEQHVCQGEHCDSYLWHKAHEMKTNYVICRTYKTPFLFNSTVMKSQMWVNSQLAQHKVYFHIGQAQVSQQQLLVNTMASPQIPGWSLQVVTKFLAGILLPIVCSLTKEIIHFLCFTMSVYLK